MDKLHKGKSVKYRLLGESYVIFICTFDVFGYGYQVYDFEMVCKRNSAIKLKDLTHRIFLCTEGDDEEISDEVRNFLDYVAGRGIKGDFIKELDEAVKKVKASKEWRLSYMTYELALMEREEEGIIKGAMRKAEEIAVKMLDKNKTFEEIQEFTELPLQRIKQLAQNS